MPPLAAIQAGLGIGQSILGLFALGKKKKAANEAFENIETYKESPYAQQNLMQAKADVNAPMPGEQEAKMGIGQTLTQSLGAAKTRKGGLQSVGAIVEQTNKAKQNLATQKAQFALGAKARLAGARNTMTGEYSKAFKSRQEKESTKYQQTLADLAATRQSISQGLGAVGGAAANLAMMGKNGTGVKSDMTDTETPSTDVPTDYSAYLKTGRFFKQ